MVIQRYNYGPLNIEKGHTRILELLPASLSDHISIRLIHFPLSADSTPHYEALSYAWGTSETPEDVLVHSNPETQNLDPSHYQAQTSIGELFSKLSVTANLASALHHLRYEDKARMLWIDALCIDQRNLEERSAEVGRMSSIYSSAKRVIVFLGPSSDECHLVHKFISHIAQDGQQKAQARRPVTDSSVFDDTFENNELDTSFMAAYNADTRMAVQRWLARPWFGRLWIWQEVHLAKEVMIVCGHHETAWREFQAAIIRLWRQTVQPDSPSVFESKNLDSLDFRKSLTLVRSLVGNYQKRTLMYLLDRTKDAQCCDPRDRIYAVLGMLDAPSRRQIVPDYSKTTRDVYTEIVLEDIKKEKSLRMFRQCEVRYSPRDLELPSWVPDFSVPKSTYDITLSCASGFSCPDAVFKQKEGSLALAGVNCATVCDFNFSVPSHATITDILWICSGWTPSAFKTEKDRSGEDLLDAYCRTLICNDVADHIVQPRGIPTLEDCRAFVLANICSNRGGADSPDIPSSSSDFYRLLAHYLPGRTFFTTSQGYIGLAPAAIQKGDLVVVLLGSTRPVLLRPVSQQDGCYSLVGSCYVHGLMDSEALLGPLPKSWNTEWRLKNDGQYSYWYVNKASGEATRQDPRLGSDAKIRRVRIEGVGMRYEDLVTRDVVKGNPRLNRRELVERGCDVRMFDLL